MAQCVRRDVLGGDARVTAGRACGVFGDQLLDRVARERAALAGRKQWVLVPPAAFGQLNPQCGNGLLDQWGGSVLAALAMAADVCSGAEVNVTAGESGQLRYP